MAMADCMVLLLATAMAAAVQLY